MNGLESLGLFIFTSAVLIMTPGLDTILVLNRSLTAGWRAGFLSGLGMSVGLMCHTGLAAFGLSLLIMRSATAFAAFKYCGAAYLCCLGAASLLRGKRRGGFAAGAEPRAAPTARKAGFYFISGLGANLLNPKVAMFFLAFFPQFVSRGHLDAAGPYFVLGLIHALMAALWFFCLSFFAALFSDRIMRGRAFKLWADRCAGSVFILMGVKLAFTER